MDFTECGNYPSSNGWMNLRLETGNNPKNMTESEY